MRFALRTGYHRIVGLLLASILLRCVGQPLGYLLEMSWSIFFSFRTVRVGWVWHHGGTPPKHGLAQAWMSIARLVSYPIG